VTYWRARPNTLVLLACATLAGAVAARDPAWLDIAIAIVINALVALSVGLTFGQAGILSAAQGSFAAIGAYTTAILTVRLVGRPGLPCRLRSPCRPALGTDSRVWSRAWRLSPSRWPP
jgi:ABC-type branched-subunit amino acid transport system permease subunit